MADRTVMLRIGANISGLQSQLRLAQNSVNEFSKKSVSYIEKNSASIDTLSNSVGVVGAGLVGLAATAVTRFAQFDKAMSAVAATGDDARGSLDALRQAAIDAGADTAFSAAEAAGAIEELAKAGVSSADILGGGLAGALSLAAAGEIDVAQAAETAASAMTQFGLAGTDVGHIADLLAAGAGKAQGGVLDMGQALNQSGLIAAQVGLSIEETTGALAAMASAGLTGSDAGTSLKTSLIALSSPSAVAAKEMERLGISAYDANGQFVGMESLAGQLQNRLGGLTDEQRNSALATIFGTDALRTANVLYSEGADGIREWTQAVDDQGFAAETAAARTDNLLGDIERLGGSLDSVFIQSGSGANDALRGIVQGAEDLVDAIGRIPAPVLTATTLIAGGGGLALLGVAGLGKLAVATVDARNAMQDLGLMSDKTSGKIGRVGKAAGALGAVAAAGGAAVLAMDALTDASDKTAVGIEQTIGALRGVEDQNIDTLFQGLGGDVNSLAEGLALLDGPHIEKFGSWLNTTFAGGVLQDQVKDTAAQFENIGEALAAMVQTGDAELAAEQFDSIARAAAEQGISVEEVQRLMPAYAEALAAAENAQASGAEATEGATSAIQDNSEAIAENLSLAAEAAGIILSEREAQRSLEAAYDDATAAIKENGKSLDVTTEKGRSNQAALDSVADGAWGVVESMYAAGASGKELSARMHEAREAFIRTATSAGATKAEARELADELGLVPSDVETILKARDQASGTIDHVKGELNGLQDKTITITTIQQVLGNTPTGTGTVLRRAGGGSIPMAPGAVPGKDSVPILGMPGEHMLTVADVKAMGGHAGVYAWRAALHGGGVQHMASGGAVGSAQRELAQQLRFRRDAAARVHSARRNDRLRDNATSARILENAEERLAEVDEEISKQRQRLESLQSERDDARRSLRRGDFRDSVTGGLSGAQGTIDNLFGLAFSGDLTKRQASNLADTARDSEKALTSLYKRAEGLESKLAAARDRLAEMQQISDSVSSGLAGEQKLASAFITTTNPWSGAESTSVTAGGLVAGAEAKKRQIQMFAGRLKKLAAAGLSGPILQEIASMGTEAGIQAADALLADQAAITQLNAAYRGIDFYAAQAGQAVTEGFGGGGLAGAAAAAKAAEAQVAAIDKKIGKWADVLARAYAKALGIKARAGGGPVTAGHAYLVNEDTPNSELFIPRMSGYVLNSQQMGNLSAGPQKVVNVYVTQNYPQAIPYSKAVNNALQHAAEGVV